MDLYQVCSNGGPGVRNGPAAGGGGGGGGGGGVFGSEMKYTSKSSSPELLGSGVWLCGTHLVRSRPHLDLVFKEPVYGFVALIL